MEKPSKKLKKILLIIGVTGGVYASFQYLLPLVVPFLFAYIFALVLRPSVHFFYRKLKKKVPLCIIGGVEMAILFGVVAILLYFGGRKILEEARLLFYNLPQMIETFDQFVTEYCYSLEQMLQLPTDSVVGVFKNVMRSLLSSVTQSAMPMILGNSMIVIRWGAQMVIVLFVFLVATILSLQEMEDLKRRRERSLFHKEFSLLSKRLVLVGQAYLRTQGIIMLVTMLICTLAFFLLKNPYNILLGIFVAILDALPILGTGTLLIPWALIQFFRRKWFYGIALLLLYAICYFVRQFLETKVMGNQMGLTPLETLMAIYVGLKLFGFFGFILGPVGLLIIEDFIQSIERNNP